MTVDAPSTDAPTWPGFDVRIEGGVAHVRLNRPEALNAMDRAFWSTLPALIADIDDNARARCVVISSTGRHFCAGMDLSVFSDGEGLAQGADDPAISGERFRRHVHHLQDTFGCLDRARMPVLVAVQGGCIGGAVDMVSACDIRWATADAFFQIQEINIGMTADVGTFPRLCKLIPEGWVRELAYTGRRLSAEQALRIGLVNAVFDDRDAMLEHVLGTAREIAAKSPLAVAGSKLMINHARDHSIADGLDYIATWQAGMFAPAHMAEAFAAQREKRPPVFPDLAPLRRGL